MILMDFYHDQDDNIKVSFSPGKDDPLTESAGKLKPEFRNEDKQGTGIELKAYEIQNPLVTFSQRYKGDYYKDLSDDYVQTDAWVCDTLGEFWKESDDDPGQWKQSAMTVLARLMEAYLKEHEELLELRER